MNENTMSSVAIAAIKKTTDNVSVLLIFGMFILYCIYTDSKNK